MHLQLLNLSCERDERVLFTALSAEIGAGEIVQISGDNGAGKTTLLRCICGLSSRYEGEIRWGTSSNSSSNAGNNRSYDFQTSLLYLGHHPGLNGSLTAMENLRWFFGLNGLQAVGEASSAVSDEDISRALALTGMHGYEDVQCRYMSAGQQRRVALARLYCSQAPFWVLDEPFTAIDKKGVAALEVRFAEHCANDGTIILSSHQVVNSTALRVLNLGDFAPLAGGVAA